MDTYLLVENASKAYGDILLFDGVTFNINEGQKTALIAKNGSGKTTLLNIIAGKDSFDTGSLYINKNIKTGYLLQDPQFDPSLTVFEAAYGAPGELMDAVRNYEMTLHSTDKRGLDDAIAKMDFYQAWDLRSG